MPNTGEYIDNIKKVANSGNCHNKVKKDIIYIASLWQSLAGWQTAAFFFFVQILSCVNFQATVKCHCYTLRTYRVSTYLAEIICPFLLFGFDKMQFQGEFVHVTNLCKKTNF